MTRIFAPYSNNSPATIEINGHRLLILSQEPDTIERDLDLLGGDEVRELALELDEQASGPEELACSAEPKGQGIPQASLDKASKDSESGESEDAGFDMSNPEIATYALAQIAHQIQGGVVLTPPGISPAIMIENLTRELPWLH